MAHSSSNAAPELSARAPSLSLFDSVCVIIGIIIGSGIYQTTPLIALSTSGFSHWLLEQTFLGGIAGAESWLPAAVLTGAWLFGASIALCGALCYAELASAYPHHGGDYNYLNRAYSRRVGFFFVWCEFWIVRPANIGAVSFVFAEYGLRFLRTSLLPRLFDVATIEQWTWLDQPLTRALLAVLAIGLLTLTNIAGVRTGIRVQNALSVAKMIGLVGIVLAAFLLPALPETRVVPFEAPSFPTSFALAVVLIMFTLGGWNDLAFVSAEVKDPRRNILRALLLGVAAVTAIYVLVSLAFVRGLGFGGLVNSNQVAADLLQSRVGTIGDSAIALLIAISTLGAINGMLYAGSRMYYALGTEVAAFKWMGVWNGNWGGPVRALMAQSLVTVLIVLAFGRSADGFERLVNFSTLPFWLFFLLVGFAVIRLRKREPETPRPYRVHFYPVVPLLFCLSSIYVLYSSTTYAISVGGWEWAWAVALVVAGDWIAQRTFGHKTDSPVNRPIATAIARLGFIALVIGSALMLLRSVHWIGEMASHFPFQWAIVGFVVAAAARRARMQWVVVASLVIAGLQLAWSGSALWPTPAYREAQETVLEQPSEPLKIASLNVLVGNSQHDQVLETIRGLDADVVVILELSESFAEKLESLRSEYPFQNLFPAQDAFGIGVISKVLTSAQLQNANSDESITYSTPQLRIQVTPRSGDNWHVGATHVIPPGGSERTLDRNSVLSSWSRELAAIDGPVIMLGDFNNTPWSASWNDHLPEGWYDSRIGFSRQPTWPSRLGWFGIPIDHALLNSKVACTERSTFEIPGSDHRGILLTLVTRSEEPPVAEPQAFHERMSPAQIAHFELQATGEQNIVNRVSAAERFLQEPNELVTHWVSSEAPHESCAEEDATVAENRAVGRDGVVASVHPAATGAGIEMFERGGNALDAAIATAFALGVCNPYNSGIGGGCFILVRTHDGRLIAIDGREQAPASAHRNLFVEADSRRAPGDQERTSETGPLASGVPGAVAAYAKALEQAGKLSLAEVLEPSIKLAAEGCLVDQPLADALEKTAPLLRRFPESARVFLKPDGTPYQAGDRWIQSDLATTYQQIAEHGPTWFYEGDFAETVANWMEQNGGLLTVQDFKDYRAVDRTPIESSYRGYRIVGFPPPSSGGVHVAQMLTMLERFPLSELRKTNPAQADHVVVEAMKLAFADRAYWLGDPDFAPVPRGLLDREYLAERSQMIDPEQMTAVLSHGIPPRADEELFERHTTHIAAADSEGNWVAITATINTTFGSKVVVPGTGVILNNEMDDFAVAPGVPNAFGLIGADANSVEAHKRPLSSMSPTLVLEGDEPVMAVGAAGGPKIITQVLWALLRTLDDHEDLAQSLEEPRLHHQWSPDVLFVERGYDMERLQYLESLGHEIRWMDAAGVSQGVARDPATGGLVGVHDPRVPGAARGWDRSIPELP